MDNRKYIDNYFNEMHQVIDRMPAADIDRAVELLFAAWQRGNQIFTCGNGGSASTATHMMCDLAKATIVADKPRFKMYCLNDNIPLMSALVNDNGFDNLYIEQLIGRFQPGDVLITISVHGGAGKDKASLWSQNLLKAMRYAKEHGGYNLGFSGFDGGPMKDMADVCIVVPANSTPHVESFHLTLEHLISNLLKEKIAAQ
ncbi:MAG: SIS domain-containing protein [Dehalococcoidales bacterium]|nr:SIS domain-containing protein [Dehalococcoidales bacterium]